MPLSRWDNIPKVMDVKLTQVPYVVLCRLNSFRISKNGTYPFLGHGRDIVVDRSGSMLKISGVITTEYEQIVPFVRVGSSKTGGQLYGLLVPIFDYDTWSMACGNPDEDTIIDYNTLSGIVSQNVTLVSSKVET